LTRTFEEVVAAIEAADTQAQAAAQRALDAKTKPRGSLGALEELAARIAGIRGSATPGRLRAAAVVAAGDHGVAAEGVSAYPQEVTRQMLANFADGSAAVCVLAHVAHATLHVVDAGVGRPTDNIAVGPAMSLGDALDQAQRGIRLADQLAHDGIGVVAVGEMGIGNSTVAAALVASLLDSPPSATVGPGTGLDQVALSHKVEVVERALRANHLESNDPLETLAALGGFEVACLCGLILGCAANRVVVVLDGFITGAAALVAARIAPAARDAMVAGHLSPEPGHKLVLDALGLAPLLDLGLRLGEGSGAALALPLVEASLAILDEMATFDSAGVSDSGR
jgi:nicotinate-nucleotide--dimethylbenzimidazole phosphoribosyltransferase